MNSTNIQEQETMADLSQAIGSLASRLPGRLGVIVRYLPDGPEACDHADDLFPAASVIKIPIMVEVYRQAASGDLMLDEPLPLLADEVTDGSGLLQYLHRGLDLTVADAVELIIAISDNTATNLLLRRSACSRSTTRSGGWGWPKPRRQGRFAKQTPARLWSSARAPRRVRWRRCWPASPAAHSSALRHRPR
jgi:hypothetical protein